MRFFTSDLHFGHANIIKYCERPFNDVPHMNEMLIHNWNSVVDYTDTVYVLGDVALGPWSEWDNLLTRLNGRKELVIGNHDRIFAGMSEKQRNKFGGHYAKWFDTISDHIVGFPVNMGGGRHKFVNMSHFPYDGDSHDEDRYDEHRLPDQGRPLLHGHTHGRNQRATVSATGTPQFHVGVDAWDFTPVPETEIVKWLETV
jgi:calcineurin-like phosphoesterase family protein